MCTAPTQHFGRSDLSVARMQLYKKRRATQSKPSMIVSAFTHQHRKCAAAFPFSLHGDAAV